MIHPMPWLRSTKTDPISTRSKSLNAEIAALEAEIRELDTELIRRRNGELSQGQGVSAEASEPAFETVDPVSSADSPGNGAPLAHFNELGVRKYDLAGAWRRLQNHFRGPASSNPRLINYLAAGSIQGLRPLRYESRVARNRVLALSLLLLFVLWGLIEVFRRG
jgi:hypothetical protein